jgi:hypothetical protein
MARATCIARVGQQRAQQRSDKLQCDLAASGGPMRPICTGIAGARPTHLGHPLCTSHTGRCGPCSGMCMRCRSTRPPQVKQDRDTSKHTSHTGR